MEHEPRLRYVRPSTESPGDGPYPFPSRVGRFADGARRTGSTRSPRLRFGGDEVIDGVERELDVMDARLRRLRELLGDDPMGDGPRAA